MHNPNRSAGFVKVSAYIVELAKAITDDLRDSLPKDQLQSAVEEELENQVLAGLVKSIGEYNSARKYSRSDLPQVNSKRRQMMRNMGYVSEMFIKQEQVKAALTVGSSAGEVDAEFEVVET